MIEIEKVSKEFSIGWDKEQTALGLAINIISGRKPKRKFYALRNISINISEGEKIGIIGLNGSGKSTLLGIIGGIYTPTSGKIKTTGKVEYLSGFSQGLKPKLTIRENIYLMGSIMGLGQKKIKSLFHKIISDADLNDYVDTRFDHLSSGMKTRLAFSVGINCLEHNDPEILLLDEIFSGGGDIRFVKKALDKMEQFILNKTVLMVSHNFGHINRYCDKVIWLEKGEILMVGKPEEVMSKYQIKYSN